MKKLTTHVTILQIVCAIVLLATIYSLGEIHDIHQRHKAEDAKAVVSVVNEDADLLAMIFGLSQWDNSPLKSAVVSVTCYSSTRRQTDDTPYHVGDGSAVKVGIIAVSPDILRDLGLRRYQRVMLIGYGIFEIRDTTAEHLTMTVDIWLPEEKAAWLHGRQTTVMVWK